MMNRLSAEVDQEEEQAKLLLTALFEKPDEPTLADPNDLLKRAMVLKRRSRFRYARQLLAHASRRDITDVSLRRRVGQQLALCTYKDPDLPIGDRLQRALEYLDHADPIATSVDPETLGIAGSIHKKHWEQTESLPHLELSVRCYRRGHEISMKLPLHPDSGYPGINAAFVLDLMANQLDIVGADGPRASADTTSYRDAAAKIRRELLATLGERPPQGAEQSWWYLVTMAEAALGVGEVDDARRWLTDARSVLQMDSESARWEYEATARQLAKLVQLRYQGSNAPLDRTPEWNAIAELLGGEGPGLRSTFRGKVGLALSGGGFRASLFHIGVLARLAEMDVLRHVEVLSCVSGGSIVGAHYYLLLRRLLEGKSDRSISRDDYVDLVQRLMRDFLHGVESNIRIRALAEFTTSLQLIFRPFYSRTRRLGELYETYIFSGVEGGRSKEPRWINELFIQPKDVSDPFNPRSGNWQRVNKVPMLVLNATTLNTGHNWQFTASYMGEPPNTIDREVDANERLRRIYYPDAPDPYKRVRLGHAVAASACVPGLFEPFTLPDLYVDDDRSGVARTVRLVDGGVHDNQGIASLNEQDCSVMIVSDASGQMTTQNQPRGDNVGALTRSSSISRERVRVEQFRDLVGRRDAGLLRGLVFVHLKKGLDAIPISWLDCKEPPDIELLGKSARWDRTTNYGIRKDIQRLLASVRTDLDSFHEVEAYALMLDGYQMIEHELRDCVPELEASKATTDWPFLKLRHAMSHAGDDDTPAQHDLLRLLRVAERVPFKVWKLPSITLLLACVASAVVVVLLLVVVRNLIGNVRPAANADWMTYLGTLTRWVGSGLFGLMVASAVWGGARIFGFRESLSQVLTGVGLGLVGVVTWPLSRLHLHIFDKVYQHRGKLDRLLNAEGQGQQNIGPSRPTEVAAS